jgi:hypothetical protein
MSVSITEAAAPRGPAADLGERHPRAEEWRAWTNWLDLLGAIKATLGPALYAEVGPTLLRPRWFDGDRARFFFVSFTSVGAIEVLLRRAGGRWRCFRYDVLRDDDQDDEE